MRLDYSFIRTAVLWQIGIAVVIAYPLAELATADIRVAVVAAWVLSVVYLCAGILFIEYSYTKSNLTFLKVVLGGITVRLLAMGALVITLIQVYDVRPLPLLISLMFFYGIGLMLEIKLLQKKASQKGEWKGT